MGKDYPIGYVDWQELLAGLLGGLALLLFGMQKMSESMKLLAGDSLKDVLGNLSKTTSRGFLTGLIVATIMQSSTVVTVMLVGFVSSNLLTFGDSIAILLGVQIGSTVVNQIVAFRITKYSLFMIAIGYPFFAFSKNVKVNYYGMFIFGCGIMFYGNELLSISMEPLKDYQPFIKLLASIDNPLLGLLVSTTVTLIIQASSATISITSALALQKLITLRAAVVFVLGANIGTVGTACISAIGKTRPAVRVAVAYLFLKVIGAFAILPFLDFFINLVLAVSPENSIARQIANSHTLYNIIVSFVFLPFTHQFAQWIMHIIPDSINRERY